jgi:hypothetical protein
MALSTFSGPVKSDNGFIAGTGTTVTSILAATATINFASISANTTTDSSAITVTGAAVGDAVFVGAPAAIESGLVITGFVSAANAVKVRAANVTAAAIDPASGAFKVVVIKTV